MNFYQFLIIMAWPFFAFLSWYGNIIYPEPKKENPPAKDGFILANREIIEKIKNSSGTLSGTRPSRTQPPS